MPSNHSGQVCSCFQKLKLVIVLWTHDDKQQGIIDTCAKFGYKCRSIRPTTHLRIGDLTFGKLISHMDPMDKMKLGFTIGFQFTV